MARKEVTMKEITLKNLTLVLDTLAICEKYTNACHVLNYDEETICPKKAMENQGETISFLSNKAFELTKSDDFVNAANYLYEHRDELDYEDKVLAEGLRRNYMRTRNISVEQDLEFSKIFNKAFVDWLEAKNKADFSIFKDSLNKVRETQLEQFELSDYDGERPKTAYNALLDAYERGVTTDEIDMAFNAFKERITPLLSKIKSSKKKIRTDFLSREVTDEQQRRMAEYLLDVIHFDKSRGAITTTEHPFTDNLAKDDARITTHYYPTAFTSSMFSVIHEGGHALFMQLQPEEDYPHFNNDSQSMAMHESVSRFYENRIGRSREFIHLIFPKCKEIFPQVFSDVTEEEFYEAINVVEPSLIRTEADEFTYTFHIIIRYELEKALVDGNMPIDDKLPERWNDLYEKYLGIRPSNDKEGLLQDVHWASGFGYFQAYAIGNMYNAMYYNKMKEDIDISKAISEGDFDLINGWMAEHVFKKANYLAPMGWIKDITGREFTPDDFLDYLTDKYTRLYEI